MNDDIFNQMGYDMPADVPESASAESFEYYRHPSGMYLSVIGKLRFKYRDLEGKNCEPTTPGAKLHNAVLPLWLKKFLGSASKPESYSILGDKLEIPSDFNGKELQSAMLYYPVIISFAAQDQWKNIQIFENFNIPNHEGYRIIQLNPQKPSEKLVVFKNFPMYYGLSAKVIITPTDKGNTFIRKGDLQLLPDERVPVDTMVRLEKDLEVLVEAERQKRQANRSSNNDGFVPEAPPESSVDDLLRNADLGIGADGDLSGFLPS